MSFSSWPGRSLMVFVPLLAAGALCADDRIEVERWLDRMAHAVESLDYRGTLVHWQGDRFDTMKIVHRSDESGVRERLFSLSGEPREILRDGNQVRSLLGGDGELVVQSQLTARLLPNLPLRRMNLASQAYAMHVRDQERVAGHQARVVEILPHDEFRYGYRFWLELQTGMLLRSALLDQDGVPVQQLTFVEIELGAPINDEELEPQIRSGVVVERRLLQNEPIFENLNAFDGQSEGRNHWVPSIIPAHFQLARQGQGESENGTEFKHLLYSDGLASFSVYIEDPDQGQPEPRLESLGSVHVYTGRVDDHQITIVGEVPMATVRLVGQRLNGEPEPSDSR